MSMTIVIGICFVIWIYLLTVLKRAELGFYTFLLGSIGLFLFLMTLIPYIQEAIVESSVVLLSFVGNYTGMYESYAEAGAFLINNKNTVMSLYIDLECSGVIEIMVFNCLLIFFPVYTKLEKVKVAIGGTILIFLFNHIRMLFILVMLYQYGMDSYFLAHTILGRIIFYTLTIILYYNVFTKKQIREQKVGDVAYVANNVI